MGVIYKLKDEVVQFIISQRQGNPLFSCRQLAESASQKFGLHLSKSSVHDVLKESGIATPRGRKPKDRFAIPQEKKKQIQVSLSQVKLMSPPAQDEQAKEDVSARISSVESKLNLIADVVEPKSLSEEPPQEMIVLPEETIEDSPAYERAGRIFLKAARWDLGIFSEGEIKETDWQYYLTYSKGIKVVLEGGKDFFIDLPLPLERCVRETADCLINNVRPLIVDKVSNEELFKEAMSAKSGLKIDAISIVGYNDHILLELSNIMEHSRIFEFNSRIFVESFEKKDLIRLKFLFIPQVIDNDGLVEEILNLRGFDAINQSENTVTLLVEDNYAHKELLQGAAERLNKMYIRDEQGRLVNVKILPPQG